MGFLFDPVGSILGLVPTWAWWVLGLLAVIFVIGVLWRLKDIGVLIHKIAGWPGVAAVVGVVLTVVYLIWPKGKSANKPLIGKAPKPKVYPIPEPYDKYGGRRFRNGKYEVFNQLTGEWDDA